MCGRLWSCLLYCLCLLVCVCFVGVGAILCVFVFRKGVGCFFVDVALCVVDLRVYVRVFCMCLCSYVFMSVGLRLFVVLCLFVVCVVCLWFVCCSLHECLCCFVLCVICLWWPLLLLLCLIVCVCFVIGVVVVGVV